MENTINIGDAVQVTEAYRGHCGVSRPAGFYVDEYTGMVGTITQVDGHNLLVDNGVTEVWLRSSRVKLLVRFA